MLAVSGPTGHPMPQGGRGGGGQRGEGRGLNGREVQGLGMGNRKGGGVERGMGKKREALR